MPPKWGDKDIGLARAHERHITVWLAGVEAQRSRVRDGFSEMRTERWADAYLFAFALRLLLRGCWSCQRLFDRPGDTPFGDAINAFEGSVPNVREMRNALDKFDREEREDGLSVFVTNDGLGDLALHVQDQVLELNGATEAARCLATACLTTLRGIG
jgi:hypothetical protein